jgi:ferric-dicitrate binding protein FerR (iron transport regulator)
VNREEGLLHEGLHVNSLSAEAMARIRAATEAEWRASLKARDPRRRWPLALAASVLLIASFGAIIWLRGNALAAPGELAAHLVRFESPGVAEIHALHRGTPLTEGAVLRAGEEYWVAGQALLALEGGGNLRVAAGTEFEIVGRDNYLLERGELYVDIPPGAHGSSAFMARTSAGEFRHVGTQFALAVAQDVTRLRVREGSVHWLAKGGESTVQAGTEVVFSATGKKSEKPLDTAGQEWDWTAKSTPDFEIEDRPLEQFLEWVARESGRKLILTDDKARQRVATIRMHGTVHGLTPLQALSAVMAATELRYDLPAGQIRVSFAGDPAPRS